MYRIVLTASKAAMGHYTLSETAAGLKHSHFRGVQLDSVKKKRRSGQNEQRDLESRRLKTRSRCLKMVLPRRCLPAVAVSFTTSLSQTVGGRASRDRYTDRAGRMVCNGSTLVRWKWWVGQTQNESLNCLGSMQGYAVSSGQCKCNRSLDVT